MVTDNGQTVQCALILMSEWKTKLPHFLSRGAGVISNAEVRLNAGERKSEEKSPGRGAGGS